MKIEKALPIIAEFLDFIKKILNALGITSFDGRINEAISKLQ